LVAASSISRSPLENDVPAERGIDIRPAEEVMERFFDTGVLGT
jgi:hypothetical protein